MIIILLFAVLIHVLCAVLSYDMGDLDGLFFHIMMLVMIGFISYLEIYEPTSLTCLSFWLVYMYVLVMRIYRASKTNV
jgi:hypothetical protein